MGISDKVWSIIAKALTNEASPMELEELHNLLVNNPSLQQQYELLQRIWLENTALPEDEEIAKRITRKIIDKAETEHIISETVAPNRRRRKRLLVFAAAAALVISVVAGLAWQQTRHSKPGKNIESLVVNKGSRSRSILPDGTTVWLNAGSKLSYENDFTGATREVRLEGEGYFDVVKEPNRPFIVHTSNIDIRVLGTAFNVKSYSDDSTIETTLFRGSVQVYRHDSGITTAIKLKPNEKLILDKQPIVVPENLSDKEIAENKELHPGFIITHIDSSKKETERFETAWLYSRLEFRDENFEQLAKKLERWYNVTIVFNDDSVKHLSFNGSFETETVEQAFVALRAALPFTYKINNHEISVGSSE